MAETWRDNVVNYVCRDRADLLWQYADCARLVDKSGKKGWPKLDGPQRGQVHPGLIWPDAVGARPSSRAANAATSFPGYRVAAGPCRSQSRWDGKMGVKWAWFKTPAIRVTVLALSTGVGSCSGFCLPRSGGISLPGGASPRVGAVGSEPPILLTRTPNGGDSSTRAGPGVDCDQAPLGTP